MSIVLDRPISLFIGSLFLVLKMAVVLKKLSQNVNFTQKLPENFLFFKNERFLG